MSSTKGIGGFSLVELMVVVAIVALLSALAIPMYQRYVVRSLVTSALYEIGPGRVPYELQINQSSGPGDYTDVSHLNLGASTEHCDVTATAPAGDGTGYIQCAIKGNAAVNGKAIRWARSGSGDWTCETSDLDAVYLPANCRHL